MSTFNPLPPPDPLTLRLTPRGNLVLAFDADAPALPSAIAQRLVAAFAAGVGPGLFYLGSTQVKGLVPDCQNRSKALLLEKCWKTQRWPMCLASKWMAMPRRRPQPRPKS
ncbi:MAG: hypothetical protein NTU86_00070 [Burkholderiales bacterium]|nr:hypothetical protein [Burkholderiales bacterium]